MTTPSVSSRSRPRRHSDMQNAKATAWGAGVMGMAGLAGALLGPSPLLLPIAPLVAIAYLPFMLASAAHGTPMGLAEPWARGQGGVRGVVRRARSGCGQAVRRLASTKAKAMTHGERPRRGCQRTAQSTAYVRYSPATPSSATSPAPPMCCTSTPVRDSATEDGSRWRELMWTRLRR